MSPPHCVSIVVSLSCNRICTQSHNNQILFIRRTLISLLDTINVKFLCRQQKAQACQLKPAVQTSTAPALSISSEIHHYRCKITLPVYPVSSLHYEAQNQRPTASSVPDVVWRYSCIRTSGIPLPLWIKCNKNNQSAQWARLVITLTLPWNI